MFSSSQRSAGSDWSSMQRSPLALVDRNVFLVLIDRSGRDGHERRRGYDGVRSLHRRATVVQTRNANPFARASGAHQSPLFAPLLFVRFRAGFGSVMAVYASASSGGTRNSEPFPWTRTSRGSEDSSKRECGFLCPPSRGRWSPQSSKWRLTSAPPAWSRQPERRSEPVPRRLPGTTTPRRRRARRQRPTGSACGP